MKRTSTFAKRLKEYREQKRITLSELEELSHIPAQTLNRYELGQRVPKVDVAVKIAEAIGVNPLWLQGYDVSSNALGSKSDQIPYEKYGLLPIEKRKIPLLGEIACGEPIFANQEYESYVEVGAAVRADFALRCKGNSMTGARIYDGDIVFVRSQPDVEDGQIAAVIIEDTVTLKRVKRAGNMLILLPENPEFQPIIYQGNELEQVRILGLAVAFQSDVK